MGTKITEVRELSEVELLKKQLAEANAIMTAQAEELQRNEAKSKFAQTIYEQHFS